LDFDGVRIFNPETKQPVFAVWAWVRVTSFQFDDDEDKDEDAMDIFTLVIEGIGQFQFECDDGKVMVQSFTDFIAKSKLGAEQQRSVSEPDVTVAVSAVTSSEILAILSVPDPEISSTKPLVESPSNGKHRMMVDEVEVSTLVPRSLLDPLLAANGKCANDSDSSTGSDSEDETTVRWGPRIRRSKSRLARAGQPLFKRKLSQEDDPAVAMQHIQEYMQKDFENVMIGWKHQHPSGSFAQFLVDKFPENIKLREPLGMANRNGSGPLGRHHNRRTSREHWVPDEAVSSCQHCEVEFTFVVRRHHCRQCGNIFCGNCSQGLMMRLIRGSKQYKRVCIDCENNLAETGMDDVLARRSPPRSPLASAFHKRNGSSSSKKKKKHARSESDGSIGSGSAAVMASTMASTCMPKDKGVGGRSESSGSGSRVGTGSAEGSGAGECQPAYNREDGLFSSFTVDALDEEALSQVIELASIDAASIDALSARRKSKNDKNDASRASGTPEKSNAPSLGDTAAADEKDDASIASASAALLPPSACTLDKAVDVVWIDPRVLGPQWSGLFDSFTADTPLHVMGNAPTLSPPPRGSKIRTPPLATARQRQETSESDDVPFDGAPFDEDDDDDGEVVSNVSSVFAQEPDADDGSSASASDPAKESSGDDSENGVTTNDSLSGWLCKQPHSTSRTNRTGTWRKHWFSSDRSTGDNTLLYFRSDQEVAEPRCTIYLDSTVVEEDADDETLFRLKPSHTTVLLPTVEEEPGGESAATAATTPTSSTSPTPGESGGVRSEKVWGEGGVQEGWAEWLFKAPSKHSRNRWVRFLVQSIADAEQFSAAVAVLVKEGKRYGEIKRALKTQYGREITTGERARIRRARHQHDGSGEGKSATEQELAVALSPLKAAGDRLHNSI
jgi:hypothetical protein